MRDDTNTPLVQLNLETFSIEEGELRYWTSEKLFLS
jgi:hypothetical protein